MVLSACHGYHYLPFLTLCWALHYLFHVRTLELTRWWLMLHLISNMESLLVTAFFKPRDPSQCKNYRPISLLAVGCVSFLLRFTSSLKISYIRQNRESGLDSSLRNAQLTLYSLLHDCWNKHCHTRILSFGLV